MNSWRCDICRSVNGSFRAHCYYCGATRAKLFWLYSKPNSWRKTHVDIDRPIHQASTSFKDVKIKELNPTTTGMSGMTVVQDVWLDVARELSVDVK